MWILIVLFIVTTAAHLHLHDRDHADDHRPERYMFLALPLLFAPIIASQPAGLGLYWITTNVWSLGQQVVVQRLIPAPTPPTPGGGEGGEGHRPRPRRERRRRRR